MKEDEMKIKIKAHWRVIIEKSGQMRWIWIAEHWRSA